LLKATAIDDIVSNASKEISYRAAITVDTLCRIEFDANSGASLNPNGSYFTASDARNAVARLSGLNVKPRPDGNFWGIIHPYIVYDLESDNTAGGFIDVMKYADPQRMVDGEVGKIGGVRFLTSTNVGTSGSSPNVSYKTYICGLGGVGAVGLVGYGPDNVPDPSKSSFKLNIIDGGPGPSDPEGQIAKFISYFFVFAVKTLDSTNLRYRFVPADASIV
jgi:N4-gp56 family major capsid protein